MFAHRFSRRCGSAVVIASLLFAAIGRAEDRTANPFPHAPAWITDQTVYEVNLRQFSPEGNVEGLRKQLPRLKELGVGTLWIMPIHPIGVEGRTGKLGSPYAVKDYIAFNPELGTLEQFKSLVDQAHRMGMYVIMDWVAPHTALDHGWVRQHPVWYNRDANNKLVPPLPAWKDVAGLNYQSKELRSAMIAAMSYWVRDVGVDGFRCDSAEFVPLDFWVEARDALRKIKPVFMLAEGNKPELMNYAFDAAYAWDLPTNMEGIAKGGKTVNDLKNFLTADAKVVPAGERRLNFTTNHDKNAFEGTTGELLGDGVAAFAVLSFTAPGIPLIYNGEEAGNDRRLSLFDKDPITWRTHALAKLYPQLAELRRNNLACSASATAARLQLVDSNLNGSVLIFRREAEGDSILVVLNLDAQPARVRVPNAIDKMSVVVSSDSSTIQDGELSLQPWGFRVWAQARR